MHLGFLVGYLMICSNIAIYYMDNYYYYFFPVIVTIWRCYLQIIMLNDINPLTAVFFILVNTGLEVGEEVIRHICAW
jgi:hypothetical protein